MGIIYGGGVQVSAVVNLDENNFGVEVLRATGLVMVVFRAPWCGFCQLMGRVLDEIARDFAGRLKVAKVNVDENQGLAAWYGVYGIPETVIFKDGQEITRVTGYKEKEELLAIVKRVLEH